MKRPQRYRVGFRENVLVFLFFVFLNHYYQKQSCEFSLSGKVGTTQGEIQLITLTLS